MMRIIVKDFYLKNIFSIRSVASIFSISKTSVHRWIHYTYIYIYISQKKRTNNICKLVEEIINGQITLNPFIRLVELQRNFTR